MDTRETNSETNEHEEKRKHYFHKIKECFNVHFPQLWESFKNNAHDSKFVVEMLGLVGLAAYVIIAAFQWRATIQVMRTDQRAWITAGQGPLHLEVNKPVEIGLSIQDTGRTPAKKFHMAFYLRQNDGTNLDFDYSLPHPSTGSGNAIFPNLPAWTAQVPLFQDNTEKRIYADEAMRNNFLAGQTFFVSYGEITYDDIFGISHWMHLCNFNVGPNLATGLTRTSPPAAKKCADYNDVDSN